MLNELGFSNLWNSDAISLLRVNNVIEHLRDQYLQKWFSEVHSMSKLSTYRTFKLQFNMEKYFYCVKNDKYRSELIRFKCSSHNLEIETGRYQQNRIDRNQRICRLARMNIIVLLVCPTHRELRRNYLPSYYCRWPSKQKFKKLIKESHSTIIKRLTQCIHI